MAISAAVTIPMGNIARISIYINKGKSLAQIKRETGADYILNGTLYDMRTGKVNCHLKANGKVWGKPPYTVSGYSWNDGPDISMDVLPDSTVSNYIACTPLIVSGKALSKLTYDRGQGGRRGRSAIGIKQGRLALYCTKDGTSMARTPEQLRDELARYGWESAVMLDGGGSSQCDFKGQCVLSSRRVHHLILVFLNHNDNEPEGEKPMVEINAYSKKADGDKKLSANFKAKEFACNDGSDAIMVARTLPMVLQYIRMRTGKAVIINSGYRTPQYNEEVGGSPKSQHTYGCAADIAVRGYTPTQIAAIAREIMPDWGGVGIYGTFTHVDVREKKADWRG